MEDICIKLPEELTKELNELSDIEKSLLVGRLLKEKLEWLNKLKVILSKSKLSEGKAEEISDIINESLSKRYDSL